MVSLKVEKANHLPCPAVPDHMLSSHPGLPALSGSSSPALPPQTLLYCSPKGLPNDTLCTLLGPRHRLALETGDHSTEGVVCFVG